ncbi:MULTISPECIES: hypothetical protein [Streptomyces]|uniref:hypothetical protein n=1 Tax=Streptomyces TaxID=1883 RepID=UPI000241A0E4|nr:MULTISPECIES: hypothetical protein [Streptomyces]EHM27211.1 hypothetical protein SPW_4353 [Streptomyces sp. W007]WTD08667.1 hypothetical protein OHA54_05210 [Streptomyces anulatus]WTD29237.1 hypothetical protein OH737_34035 [Streptomyces anulatus]WTE01955.1 hypothetical protein OH765_05215 [Streptomyces anulatus]WTE25000.1 hypothetical protein OHB50_04985 [Streptomyces anulatus]
MTFFSRPGILTTVERRWADNDPTPPLRLFDGTEPAGVPLSLDRARALLYDRTACSLARASLWHQVAERFRTGGTDWREAVVWLGLQGLRRNASRITWCRRADREDVEAELVTCYLEELAKLDPQDPEPGRTVLRSACSRAWEVWRDTHRENTVEDVERAGGTSPGAGSDDVWRADYDPAPRWSGLSASLRISVPAHRVEGVRIGALASAWGVAGTATSIGHSGRGRRVAALSLRRVGRKG